MARLVLASASPRRQELLAAAGLSFDVAPAEVDETRAAGEPAERYVERLARWKAESVERRHPGRPVLGADTVVVVDDGVLGKPGNPAEAASMLAQLSGRPHVVMTGVALTAGGQTLSGVERTTVWMSALSTADIAWYVESGEPLDKAGAYAIQGLASRFIPRIDGSYSNVVGLPIATVVALMRQAAILD